MKYYTLGITFFFINLIIILISFYYINLTKLVEKEIDNAQLKINLLQDEIKINELEYAAHINLEYLRKLEQIYFSNKYNEKVNLMIVGIDEFNSTDLGQVFRTTSY